MKVKLKIVKHVELPALTISNLDDLGNESLNEILREVHAQIKAYFPGQEIAVRERYAEGPAECPFCHRLFDNVRGMKMHVSKSHEHEKTTPDLYLSAHRINTSVSEFLYIMLESPRENGIKSQAILKLKFPS